MKDPIYSKLERAKEFIKFFFEKYKPICCFCGISLGWESFFPRISGHKRDEFTIHHLDHNRKNNKITNKAICHRDCHRRHHREEQLFKESNPNKKYSYTACELFVKKQSKTYKV